MKHSPAPYWIELTLTAPPYDEFESINDNAPFITANPTGNGLDALNLIAAAPNLLFRLKKVSDFLDLHKADLMGEDWRTMMVGIKNEISDL